MADFPASSEVNSLDTERILRALDVAGVDYVLIGGVACLIHGASRVTVDADLVPARDSANLACLLEALRAVGAAVFVAPDRAEMESGDPWEVETLRAGHDALLEADVWHFTTDAGPIDVVLTAAGVGDFEEHLAKAEVLDIFDMQIRVAGLDDLIKSKETLQRAKDLSVLDELRQLRAERA